MSNEILTQIKLDLDQLRADLKEAEKAGKDAGQRTGAGLGGGIEAGVSKSLVGLKSAFLAAGTALIGAFVSKEAISAAVEQQSATFALNSAMALAGTYTKAASDSFQNFAASLQNTTGAADEVIIQGGALLVTLGRLKGEGLERATKASLDLAAGLAGQGMTPETAFNLVSKAAAGNVSALSRYGIKVKETGDKAIDFENVMKALESRFQGMAEMQTGTFAGAMNRAKNLFGEVLESIGNIVVKSPTAMKAINSIGDMFLKAANAIENFASGRDLVNEAGVALVKFGGYVNTYLIVPLELAFNILKTGVLTIATAFTGLITIIGYVGEAIFGSVIKPVVDFIGGALAKLVSFIDADMAASLNTFVQNATQGVVDGYKVVGENAAAATASLAGSMSDAANNTFNFDAAAKSAEWLASADEFFATVTPVTQANLQKISNGVARSLPETMFNSFSNGFLEAAKKVVITSTAVAQTLKNLGAQIYNTMATGTANAFSAMGAAMVKGENGMAAFGKAMLGVLGDIAIQFGTTFMAMGVGKTLLFDPTGPLLVAAGAALMGIGGALKALSGGGGAAAGASAPAVSGGGVGAAGGTMEAPTIDTGQSFNDMQRGGGVGTKVEVNVAGNILDRRQTGLELVDVLNEAFGNNAVALSGAV